LIATQPVRTSDRDESDRIAAGHKDDRLYLLLRARSHRGQADESRKCCVDFALAAGV